MCWKFRALKVAVLILALGSLNLTAADFSFFFFFPVLNRRISPDSTSTAIITVASAVILNYPWGHRPAGQSWARSRSSDTFKARPPFQTRICWREMLVCFISFLCNHFFSLSFSLGLQPKKGSGESSRSAGLYCRSERSAIVPPRRQQQFRQWSFFVFVRQRLQQHNNVNAQ